MGCQFDLEDLNRGALECAFDHAGRPCAAFSTTRREDRPNTALPTLVEAVRGAARQLTQVLSGRAPDGWFAVSRSRNHVPSGT